MIKLPPGKIYSFTQASASQASKTAFFWSLIPAALLSFFVAGMFTFIRKVSSTFPAEQGGQLVFPGAGLSTPVFFLVLLLGVFIAFIAFNFLWAALSAWLYTQFARVIPPMQCTLSVADGRTHISNVNVKRAMSWTGIFMGLSFLLNVIILLVTHSLFTGIAAAFWFSVAQQFAISLVMIVLGGLLAYLYNKLAKRWTPLRIRTRERAKQLWIERVDTVNWSLWYTGSVLALLTALMPLLIVSLAILSGEPSAALGVLLLVFAIPIWGVMIFLISLIGFGCYNFAAKHTGGALFRVEISTKKN